MIIPTDLFYSLPKDVQKSVILTTAGNDVCVCICAYECVCFLVCQFLKMLLSKYFLLVSANEHMYMTLCILRQSVLY